MKLGIDRLLSNPTLQKQLHGKKLALAGHPASVTSTLTHSLDALMAMEKLSIVSAIGPQHGMRGEKQDNMVETENYVDPVYGIPIFSLYGEVRRPTAEMMDSFDVLLFDIQDIGCRIYTYVTTLLYLLEACEEYKKAIWILDRPNPAGRPIEGSLLRAGWESFVGAGPIIMRHGLTMGEMALWFVQNNNISVELNVVEMEGYDIDGKPGFGWPSSQLSWVNPSPNASSLNMARCYAGTVMLEGTTLSEGRGTTVALEVAGAPDIDIQKIIGEMSSMSQTWMAGADIRPCYFQPTFHKHEGKCCEGIQIHTDNRRYNHNDFKPYRVTLLFFKAILQIYSEYPLWRDFPYEYVEDKLAIDVINGGSGIREWVENPNATIEDMELYLQQDEKQWKDSVVNVLLY